MDQLDVPIKEDMAIEEKKQKVTKSKRKVKQTLKIQFSLASPNILNWESIDESLEKEICEEITRVFTELRIKKLRKVSQCDVDAAVKTSLSEVDGKLTGRSRKYRVKKNILSAQWQKSEVYRKKLVFGLTENIRELEKGSLCALLISKNALPDIVTHQLLSSSYLRNIYFGVITNLQETLTATLGFKKCAVLGVKKQVLSKSYFKELLSKIQKIGKWTKCGEFYKHISKPATEKEVVEAVTSTKEETTLVRKDYNHLYVKKDAILPLKQAEKHLTSGDGQKMDDEVNKHENQSLMENSQNAYKTIRVKRIKPATKTTVKRLKKV